MKKLTLQEKKNIKGYWFLLPFILGFTVLFAYPLVQSFLYSLGGTNTASGYKIEITGFDMYFHALREDTKFYRYLIEALADMITKIPIIMIFSFIIANFLKNEFPGRNFIRLAFFIPVIISSGVVPSMETGNLVQSMVNESVGVAQEGLINEASLQEFLTDINFPSTMASYIVGAVTAIVDIINSSGIQILIFLTALQAIPSSLYEASSIEGATVWDDFWKITFPMVTPQMVVCLVYTIVDSVCSANNDVVDYIYNTAFLKLEYGFASAMSWIYTAMIVIILLAFAGVAALLSHKYEQ